jgi:hypothetical protein
MLILVIFMVIAGQVTQLGLIFLMKMLKISGANNSNTKILRDLTKDTLFGMT